MAYPSKDTKIIEEIIVEATAFKKNILFWKSIGGQVKAFEKRKRRRWWCLWICKTHDKYKHADVSLFTYYYGNQDIGGTRPILVELATREDFCENVHKCLSRHFAVGASLKFPTNTINGLADLPLDGVIAIARVTIRGQSEEFRTSKGSVPEDFRSGFLYLSVLHIMDIYANTKPTFSIREKLYQVDKSGSLKARLLNLIDPLPDA